MTSNPKSPRALIEELHGYVTGVSDRKGYTKALQEIEARLTGETGDDRAGLLKEIRLSHALIKQGNGYSGRGEPQACACRYCSPVKTKAPVEMPAEKSA